MFASVVVASALTYALVPFATASICPQENHTVCNAEYPKHRCVCSLTTNEEPAPEMSCNKLLEIKRNEFPAASVIFKLDDHASHHDLFPEEKFREELSTALKVDEDDIIVLRIRCIDNDERLAVQFVLLSSADNTRPMKKAERKKHSKSSSSRTDSDDDNDDETKDDDHGKDDDDDDDNNDDDDNEDDKASSKEDTESESHPDRGGKGKEDGENNDDNESEKSDSRDKDDEDKEDDGEGHDDENNKDDEEEESNEKNEKEKPSGKEKPNKPVKVGKKKLGKPIKSSSSSDRDTKSSNEEDEDKSNEDDQDNDDEDEAEPKLYAVKDMVNASTLVTRMKGLAQFRHFADIDVDKIVYVTVLEDIETSHDNTVLIIQAAIAAAATALMCILGVWRALKKREENDYESVAQKA